MTAASIWLPAFFAAIGGCEKVPPCVYNHTCGTQSVVNDDAAFRVHTTSVPSVPSPSPSSSSSASSTPTPSPGQTPGPIDPYASYAYVRFTCEDGHYNELATLFFAPQENAIKRLFHSDDKISMTALLLFMLPYLALSCWTYGLCIPSGLFIPALLAGSAYGRLVGEALHMWIESDAQGGDSGGSAHATFANGIRFLLSLGGSGGSDSMGKATFGFLPALNPPGVYALIGAAAMLGGVTRMVVSLTVILVESTGNVSIGLPLLLTLFAARWAGNRFNEGIYDIHIEISRMPFLQVGLERIFIVLYNLLSCRTIAWHLIGSHRTPQWQPPKFFKHLRAEHVMSRRPRCVRSVERVSTIIALLNSCKHNGFPVVSRNKVSASAWPPSFASSLAVL